MKQRLGDPKQGMLRMDGASSQMILHSVFFSTSIAFLLYFVCMGQLRRVCEWVRQEQTCLGCKLDFLCRRSMRRPNISKNIFQGQLSTVSLEHFWHKN